MKFTCAVTSCQEVALYECFATSTGRDPIWTIVCEKHVAEFKEKKQGVFPIEAECIAALLRHQWHMIKPLKREARR